MKTIKIYLIEGGRKAFLALFVFSSIAFFNFYSDSSISKGIPAAVAPTATPTPGASNDSFDMDLDRYTVIYPCPSSFRCVQGKGDKDLSVEVVISKAKPEDNSLRYEYTASVGRITGEGAKVIWNLIGEQSGTYEITVAIKDKSGNALQTITKTITLLENDEDGDRCLNCPELSVDAPAKPTQAGDAMFFMANVKYGTGEKMIYNWTVTNGKIIEGQGTTIIKVATDSTMAGKTVEATANFKWDCSEICNSTASASGLVAAKPRRDK